MRANPVRNLLHPPRDVPFRSEIHKLLRAYAQRQRLLLFPAVDHDWSHPHRFGELHALDPYAASAAGEDDPVAGFEV